MFAGMKHMLLLLVVLLSACRKEDRRKVRYEVTCASCDLTYSNSSADTEQRTIATSWNYEFNAEGGQFLYISAQNNNSSGSVAVKILLNGDTFKSASSSGAYVIATASGSAPD